MLEAQCSASCPAKCRQSAWRELLCAFQEATCTLGSGKRVTKAQGLNYKKKKKRNKCSSAWDEEAESYQQIHPAFKEMCFDVQQRPLYLVHEVLTPC